MPILERFCLIYLRSGKRVKRFMSDTMVGLVNEDRRTGDAEVSSEVHQKATK